MDVLTAFTSRLQADGDSDCKVQLLEHLGAQRMKHTKKMQSLLRKDGSALLKRLKRTSTRTQKLLRRAQQNGHGTAPTAMAEALKLSSELADPLRLDRKNLHPYRLKVKHLRYVLQMAENSDQAKFVEKLGEVKDAIGEWHDWEELIAIAEDVLDHRPSCGLVRELKVISEKKYQRALHMANELRAEYIRSRRAPPGKKSRELARPVLTATSAMAAGS